MQTLSHPLQRLFDFEKLVLWLCNGQKRCAKKDNEYDFEIQKYSCKINSWRMKKPKKLIALIFSHLNDYTVKKKKKVKPTKDFKHKRLTV